MQTRSVLAVASLSLASLLAGAGCTASSDDTGSSDADLVAATSGYTSLEANDCAGAGGARKLCKGMGGFELVVDTSADAGSAVAVKTGGKEIDLGLSRLDELAYATHLGPKAEWRGSQDASGVKPYAVIFRVFVPNGAGDTNYLAVAHLDAGAACLVGTVSGAIPDHNVKAREIADANRDKACAPTTGPAIANGESIYTDLQDCPMTAQAAEGDGDWAEFACTGAGGYALKKSSSDLRDYLTIKSPAGETRLQHMITGGFSFTGPKAEWRVSGADKKVHALVFRFTESEGNNPDGTSIDHQYMMVAKVLSSGSCITDVIDVAKHPGDHNVLARVAADASPTKVCPASTPAPR